MIGEAQGDVHELYGTVNLPARATVGNIEDIYVRAWQMMGSSASPSTPCGGRVPVGVLGEEDGSRARGDVRSTHARTSSTVPVCALRCSTEACLDDNQPHACVCILRAQWAPGHGCSGWSAATCDNQACGPSPLAASSCKCVDHRARVTTNTESADTPSDVAARVGALLSAADRPVTTSTLADALHLALPLVEDALAELTDRLQTLGMALQRDEDGLRVVTTLVDDEPLQHLLRAQHAAHGLTATDATVLYRALSRTLETRTLGKAERVALARMQNAGVLEGIAPTTDTAFALHVSGA